VSLSETRIVLFEKAGFKKNFHVLLDEIEMHINDSKRGNNKCILISPVCVKHKLVKKILNENGYIVTISYNSYNSGQKTKISWY
jgi:hypothetical protein